MRLISGTAGGLHLEVPKSLTRPTQDRVRQAMFSMFGDIIAESRVLDLYAGSGAFGLEALSRGATSAMLIDQDRRVCEVIHRNIAKTRLQGASVRQADVIRALTSLQAEHKTFDLVFADPPYVQKTAEIDSITPLLTHESLPHLIVPGGYLVLECLASRKPIQYDPALWQMLSDRTYGSTRILLLSRSESRL